MGELAVKIPDDIMEEVEKHSEVNWSEVIGKAVKKELEERAKRKLILTALKKVLENSKLTEKDALELGDELKDRMWKRYQEEGW